VSELDLGPIQAFLAECLTEQERAGKQLGEIELLIQQTEEEIDKLAQQNAEIANRLRQMETDLEAVPRKDVQHAYAVAQRAQGRLFTMRGQLEILGGKRDALRERRELLERTVEILRSTERTLEASRSAEATFTPEQSMIVRIIQAQENERQRLSRRMHDEPAQLLTNLILKAEICQRLLDVDPARARDELESLKAEVHKTFQRTREFIADLRPMMLDDLGLIPTMKRYVSSWSEKTGIETELSTKGQPHRLAPYSEVTIFRAIQQLMQNVEQHANATRVQVSLELDGRIAHAVVEDDGIGFDIDEVMAAAGARKTIGIASIMDRVQMLGGSLVFESTRGVGTKAVLEVPEN
jgi:two-component system sensor histidine kinase DegS